MAIIITGGAFRGRKLATDTRAQVIRPTSGKVREALFSSLGESVPGSRFVDLYAGTGAVGLEALSRGAGEAHLVESHPQSWLLLQGNARSVLGLAPGPDDRLHLHRTDAAAFVRARAALGEAFDLVFADPPFDRDQDFRALPALLLGILASGGTAVIQFPTRNPPAWLERAGKVRKYGESSLAFFDSDALSAAADGIPVKG
jgi:16S rRNA (guanine(966)-N(2))-methyltransferase RsmD